MYFLYSNFKTINVANYGNCFMFNSEYNENDDVAGQRVTSLTGPSFGLELEVELDIDSHLDKFTTQVS